MTNNEILILNLTAFFLRNDDCTEVIEFTKNHPEVERRVDEIYAQIMSGPFGEIDMNQSQGQCECQAMDGYLSAIDEMVALINSRPFPHRGDHRAITIEREQLVNHLLAVKESFRDSPPTQQ